MVLFFLFILFSGYELTFSPDLTFSYGELRQINCSVIKPLYP